jgi:DNA-binding beta-propeller fold protein YncE
VGLAVDGVGNIYVADRAAHRILKLSPTGDPLAQWGRKGSGPGEFNSPIAVALDRGNNLYVADSSNNRIQKLSPTGEPLAQFQFQSPYALALDQQGNTYVADRGGDGRIQKLSPDGHPIAQWGGRGSSDLTSLALDQEGNIYVADIRNHSVRKLSPTGELVAEWTSVGGRPFDLPWSVAVDRAGNIYVADLLADCRRGNCLFRDHRIQKLSPTGELLAEWGGTGSDPGQFRGFLHVAVDNLDNLYVANSGRVQKLPVSAQR